MQSSKGLISSKTPSLEKSSDNNITGKKNQKSFSSDGLQPIHGDCLDCVAVDLQVIGQESARLALEIVSGASSAPV